MKGAGSAGRPAPRENLPRRETMQKLTAATVFAELQGKEIALIGLGVSHRPVAKLLAQKGMKVIMCTPTATPPAWLTEKYPEVLNDYSEVIRIDSNYIYAYYNRAMLRAEVGEKNAAIRDLDKVVEMNPDNILIYFNRGLLKMDIRDWYGAYDDFTESIHLYPDFVKAYLARAAVNQELKDFEAADKDHYLAMQIMDRYKRMKEGDKNALVDTTANFQKLIDINARHDEVRDVINGRVQDKKVIIELQDVFYVQYLSLDSLRSGKVQYYNRHIMDYNQAHNYNPAITLCNKDLVYPADFAESYVEELTGRIMQTGDADAYLIRGSIYLNQKEYAKAIEDFSAILEKEPDNLLALFNLANARMLTTANATQDRLFSGHRRV